MPPFTFRPTRPDPDARAQQFATALMDAKELTAPLLDAADGMRADLAARGWSPETAEGLAATWLQGMFTLIMGGRSR